MEHVADVQLLVAQHEATLGLHLPRRRHVGYRLTVHLGLLLPSTAPLIEALRASRGALALGLLEAVEDRLPHLGYKGEPIQASTTTTTNAKDELELNYT